MASCPRWSPSRTCTARRRSCRTPASCCRGFPAWAPGSRYGLGSLNDEPADLRGAARLARLRPNGPANWGAGFLPAAHQGTMVRPAATTRSSTCSRRGSPVIAESERDGLALLNTTQSAHIEPTRPGDSRLEARIASYELAARMQLITPEVLDLSRETRATRKLYGLDDADHRGLRPQLPDRPAAARARRALRAGLERRRQRLPAPQLGQARGHRPRPRPMGASMDRPRRRPDQGPEAARHARRHDHHLDDRIRPDAVQPGRQGPRPQPVHVHELAGRRRHQGGRHLRRQR